VGGSTMHYCGCHGGLWGFSCDALADKRAVVQLSSGDYSHFKVFITGCDQIIYSDS
jgi:hypothetical protein